MSAWFRLRLVTAQRGGELLQMRWQDVDPMSHFWTIPGGFVKNAHGHRVYLNDLARKLLATVPRDKKDKKSVWVFPKSFMGDFKHVGRRLAQSTRANIITETKESSHGREHDGERRRTAVRDQPNPESLGGQGHHECLRPVRLRRREESRDGILEKAVVGNPERNDTMSSGPFRVVRGR
ncbi:MAG: tyrosine-type recombinase/integrase [bacterium]